MITSGMHRRTALLVVLVISCMGGFVVSQATNLSRLAFADVPLTQISEDTYTHTTSQHATQVEPHAFAFGDTIVVAIQSGRFFDGGASNIAFATSQNGGATWVTGNLPGITTSDGAGPYGRVSDPSVAFAAKDNVWLISSLALLEVPGGLKGAAVLVSRSTDGGHTWDPPVTVAAAIDGDGKVYVVWQDCRFRPRCTANDIVLSTSTDGTSWTAPVRIPIDATDSGVDHFIPGLAADRSTAGNSTRLGLTYYFYPDAGPPLHLP